MKVLGDARIEAIDREVDMCGHHNVGVEKFSIG